MLNQGGRSLEFEGLPYTNGPLGSTSAPMELEGQLCQFIARKREILPRNVVNLWTYHVEPTCRTKLEKKEVNINSMLFTFCIVVFSQLKSWCFRTHPTSITSLPSQGRHFPVQRPLHRHGRVQIRRRKKRRLALLVAFAPGGPRDATVATDGADGAADLAFSKCCGVPYPYYTHIYIYTYIYIYIYNNIDIVDLFVEGQRYIKRTWCKQNGSNGQYL